jgi:hypothetical protein
MLHAFLTAKRNGAERSELLVPSAYCLVPSETRVKQLTALL